MSKVDIVIVNWNSGDYLRACLSSVLQFGTPHTGRIVVVDNDSGDGSAELPHDIRTRVTVIEAGRNLGFGRACNIGAAICTSPYVLFLNPDARLMPGSLDAALTHMESPLGKHTGICGVRLLDDEGQTQRHCARFPGLMTYVGYMTGLSRLMPRLIPPLQMWDFDHLESCEVDHVIGAFFFVRKSVFDALKGFDERFFVYLEDLDFSLRARQLGYRSFYIANGVAYHRGGGSSEKIKATRLAYSLQSRSVYVRLHFGRLDAWVIMALTFTLEPLTRVARALARGSFQEVRETTQAYGRVLFQRTTHRGTN